MLFEKKVPRTRLELAHRNRHHPLKVARLPIPPFLHQLRNSCEQCPEQDSNLHASRHTHLKRARLPIPPPGHHGITVCKSNTFFLNANILGRFFRKKLLVEVFIVKNQQINHGYRDISIGQVENCTEEVVAAIDQEIEESGNAVPLKERKVEHIHDFAHHESCVVASEMGDRVGCGGREDQPVKGAVDDVADRSGQNQPESDQHSFGRFFAHEMANQPDQCDDHADPEKT